MKTFEREVEMNNLEILEKGITVALPDFDSLMFTVVKKIKIPHNLLKNVWGYFISYIIFYCSEYLNPVIPLKTFWLLQPQ